MLLSSVGSIETKGCVAHDSDAYENAGLRGEGAVRPSLEKLAIIEAESNRKATYCQIDILKGKNRA